MVSRKSFYGGICAVSLIGGALSAYGDYNSLLLALPIFSAVSGLIKEAGPYLDGPTNLGSLLSIPFGIAGTAAGTLTSLFSESIGYGLYQGLEKLLS